MEGITGEPLEGEFYPALQDGSYLCKLFNKLFPSSEGENPIIPAKHTKKVTGSSAMVNYFIVYFVENTMGMHQLG